MFVGAQPVFIVTAKYDFVLYAYVGYTSLLWAEGMAITLSMQKMSSKLGFR